MSPLRCLLLSLMLLTSVASSAAPLHFGEERRWIDIPFNHAATGVPMFGKVNRDDKADLVYYNPQRGEAYVALSTGRAFAAPTLFASGLPRFAALDFQPLLADVNGDGMDDLIVMNRGPHDVAGAATAVVALSTGTSFVFPATPVWNPSWCAKGQTCLSGDFNGDRRQDLVAITQDFGTVFTTLSTGSAFGPNAIWNNFFCIRNELCAVGDVDGDKKADLLLFKPSAQGNEKGNVLIARSTGSAFVDVRYGHGFFCIDGETCLAADVNGDGRTDIVLVKGWGSGAQLEVLVSLSDGNRFINATPFAWARPGYLDVSGKRFGRFFLADVTGDGKADLVQIGLLSTPLTGGGNRTTGTAANVQEATTADAAPPPTGGAPSRPVVPGGFSAVEIYNCHPDQERLHYWTVDRTSGRTESTGLVDAMSSETGFCPDPNDGPERIDLEDGHEYTLIAVNPSAIGCEGRNDPSIVGCVYNGADFRGSANGPVCRWVVSAQALPAGCVAGLTGQSLSRLTSVRVDALPPDQMVSVLARGGVDTSVPAATLHDWLSNAFTPYPFVAQVLVGLLDGKPLKHPVHIDVIVWHLEHGPGAHSPRRFEEVDIARLKAAVVSASNSRHGTRATRFEELLH